MRRVLIPHIDDLAVTHGANRSMAELAGAGFVTSGSVMVPCPWFPELAALARRRPELDLGIHLTLTSESAACRWGPISTRSKTSGLIDGDGYFWPDLPTLRRHADLQAVAEELRAQIEHALASGIDVTHLDHHMGAALAPDYVAITAQLGEEYGLPVLFPASVADYFTVLRMRATDIARVEQVRDTAATAVIAEFLIGLEHRDEDIEQLYRRYVADAGEGITFLSLHCNAPGEVERVHPNDAAWRIAEDALFRRPDFLAWVADQGVELAGFRRYRDALGS